MQGLENFKKSGEEFAELGKKCEKHFFRVEFRNVDEVGLSCVHHNVMLYWEWQRERGWEKDTIASHRRSFTSNIARLVLSAYKKLFWSRWNSTLVSNQPCGQYWWRLCKGSALRFFHPSTSHRIICTGNRQSSQNAFSQFMTGCFFIEYYADADLSISARRHQHIKGGGKCETSDSPFVTLELCNDLI